MVETDAEKLQQFKVSRSSIKGSQTKIKNYVDQNFKTMTEFDATTRLGVLENYFTQFQNVQSNIERLDPSEIDKDSRDVFVEAYCTVKSKLLSVQYKTRRESAANLTDTNTSIVQSSRAHAVRLPKLELPHFSGKYTEWNDFYKTFTTLVHNNETLSSVEKFTHLRNCLKDPAINTIKSLEITDENYAEALKMLSDRYNNERAIFHAHIREICELKPSSKNAVSLRFLIDSVNSNFRALKGLGSYEDMANAFLVFLVCGKLDAASLSKWEEEADSKKLPKWSDLEAILNKRCLSLESKEFTVDSVTSSSSKSDVYRNNSYRHKTCLNTTVNNVVNQKRCLLCNNADHDIYQCQKFNTLSPSSRFDEVKKLALCINCLQGNHRVRFCKAGPCRKCGYRHHTLLHFEKNFTSPRFPKAELVTTGVSALKNEDSTALTTSLHSSSNPSPVILATAILNARNINGDIVKCRVLLDSASQLNFISNALADILRLKRLRTDFAVNGLNDIKTRVKHKVFVKIESRASDYMAELEMFIVPSITSDQPVANIDISSWNLPSNIIMADPEFHCSRRVDGLIGAEVFFDLLGSNHFKLEHDSLHFHETKLGWIAAGKINSNNCKCVFSTTVDPQISEVPLNIEQQIEKFWTIEGYHSEKKLLTIEEQECEENFVKNTIRDDSGRFIVKLPLKHDVVGLGDSYWIAKTRFLNLEKKLTNNPEIRKQYHAFLNEYESLGHMQKIDENERHKCKYFLPHHCVIKPESTSTKLRVVFDASSKTNLGNSLNSIMNVGPTIQKDLFAIVLRFRSRRFALTADISKMYRQVKLDEEQSYLQCILWRASPTEPIDVFRLKTVTYGTAAASFLVIRCLHQLANENETSFPLSSKAIREDFYVDDMLSGADTIEEALRLQRAVTDILKAGGFDLRKWASNDVRLLEQVPNECREKSIGIDSNNFVKTLGLFWQPEEDVFLFDYSPKSFKHELTKRSVLSDIATLFDPLGLLNPVIVLAKIFMQHLWRLKIGWDEQLPRTYQEQWEKFRSQLPLIKLLKFPRFVFSSKSDIIQLHGFADASTSAYGCCVYVRCISNHQVVACHLLCAKSRVAPIKTISLPRLELCAAETLAELLHRIVSELEINVDGVFCWTDSEIVLNWLAAHPSNWTTFVSNRVSTIQRLTNEYKWNHVDTKNNPADLVSRGMLPEKLIKSSIWFTGPEFLSEVNVYSHIHHKDPDIDNAPERRKVNIVMSMLSKPTENVVSSCKFVNSFQRLRRVFAYVHRFVDICHKRKISKADSISTFTPEELNRAQRSIIYIVQHDAFPDDIKHLLKNEPLQTKSALKGLSPFIDDHQIVRVGGRLREADLSYDVKYPILLPKNHQFVFSLFEHFHLRNLHVGPQALLAAVRRQFWVIGGRDIARRIVRRCIVCFRHRPIHYQQIMGNLPAQRVQPARPFVNSGVDFCGPVKVHYKHRGQRPTKAYIAIFICLATKAVHVELVSDLTSNAFIAALKRFVSRRGLCHTLFCDNGTNFVGGRRRLEEVRKMFFDHEIRDHIIRACSEDIIRFVHIPPRSPHFGGLWEAAVKSAKHLLNRTLDNSALTYEELTTMLAQVEAVLNSRPLTPMSADPSDLRVLTAGHLLIGEPLITPIEIDLSTLNINRLDRYQRIRRMQQHFWERWSREYMYQLQTRSKWRSSSYIKLGTMVLVSEDNVPPQKWIYGRIVELHAGKDGNVRVVTVKTSSGLLKRAVHKLAPLPIDDEDN